MSSISNKFEIGMPHNHSHAGSCCGKHGQSCCHDGHASGAASGNTLEQASVQTAGQICGEADNGTATACDGHCDDDESHSHSHSHGHSHGGRCACHTPVTDTAGLDQKGLSPEQKREVLVMSISAVLFALTMIFEESLTLAAGPWPVRLLYAIPYFLCGVPVFKNAWHGLRSGDYLNEFTLMGLATVAAVVLGHLAEAVGVMLFYSIGEFLQELAARNSRGSIRALLASRPTTANILSNGEVKSVPVEDIAPGDRLVVRPGEKVPLDGVVVAGSSQIDTSPLTGESMPVGVGLGDKINAGSINMNMLLEMEATSRFADTHMARILEMVENAAARKSPTERFITRFARYYTPAVVLVATLVAILPPLLGGAMWETWIYRALVLLVISCPCALLVSIPLGYFGGIGLASRHGILVKGGNVMDGILKTGTVIFDKTGTLTQGSFSVTARIPAEGVSSDELLAAAAMAESESNHPIAVSIMSLVDGFNRPADLVVEEVPGQGMHARSGNEDFYAGNAALMRSIGLDAPEVTEPGSVVYVAQSGRYLGYLLVADTLKEDAPESIAALRSKGLKTVILSGDREQAVAWAAKRLGPDAYRSQLLPGDKVRAMEEVADPEKTAFVGDGINDAPGLALARVGIAMGGIGSEAAIEAADAVILNDSPLKVATLYDIAGKVKAVVWQNIVLALGVKGLIMCFGVAGLSGLWEAVFADVGVALLAVLNVVRVMRVK
ncbi:cadmium-translocating P-type ATPase [Desulfovibrio sp. OttesenSCG-928-C06]|nr:cadmium-translocating P-type ATPase [Desulfovibrio sp. OttesenSCG-928-C06]